MNTILIFLMLQIPFGHLKCQAFVDSDVAFNYKLSKDHPAKVLLRVQFNDVHDSKGRDQQETVTWKVKQGPKGADFSNAKTMRPTFITPKPGYFIVEAAVSNTQLATCTVGFDVTQRVTK